MAAHNIFCNIPWYEININQDGSYDLCGCQNDKISQTPLGEIHNIKVIPIEDYWNGERIRNSRLVKLGNDPDPMCKMCQLKDRVGYQSNRVKENLKSAIFPENFDRSYQQSLGYEHFAYSEQNQGYTTTTPHSLHVNLGNTCNFACRMCGPLYSTRLQTEFKQLGWSDRTFKTEHWADTETGWDNFVEFLDAAKENIKVIHIIGGEVEFIPKFHFLIDYFIDQGLASDINISFTSNGSVDYRKYFTKLSKYKRCEIGFSVESVEPIGNYIRQGGNNVDCLKNIQSAMRDATDNLAFTLRTVPSLLSLPHYSGIVSWALENKIPMDNSILVHPEWLSATLLNDTIKQSVISDMRKLLASMSIISDSEYSNQKNANFIDKSIQNECNAMIELASMPFPENGDNLLRTCADNLKQWDKLKNTNLKDYSLPLYDLLSEYGYEYEGH